MTERTCRSFADPESTAVQSCTDPDCPDHRFDLYSALLGVADAWFDSLPSEPLRHRSTMSDAFLAVAALAAAEVFE